MEVLFLNDGTGAVFDTPSEAFFETLIKVSRLDR